MPSKRANNEGTIRQRPNGRWEARFTVGTNPGTGTPIRKSIYGDTQEEVRKALQKACTAVDEGIYTEPSKLTVKKWLDIYLEEYTGNLKMYSLRNYKAQMNNHVIPAIGAIKLSALSVHTIQSMYNRLHKKLSAKTLRNIHGILHRALKQAVLLGYLRVNPSDACTLPRVVRKEIHPLADDEIKRFLEAIKGHRHENLFLVDLFTGMRQGEILGLQWSCVDFENGTISIDKQLYQPPKGGTYTFETLKNNKSRALTPAPFVMQALKAERVKQNQRRLLAGEVWDEGMLPGLVFTNELGGHLAHGTVYNQFKAVVRQCGVPSVRFHDLRHSFAVASLRSGDDVKTVQENMGHHTAAFTLDNYGHVTEQMKRESANRMEAFIQGLT